MILKHFNFELRFLGELINLFKCDLFKLIIDVIAIHLVHGQSIDHEIWQVDFLLVLGGFKVTLELHNAILKKLHDLALHDFHTIVQVGLDCKLLFFLLGTTSSTHLNDLLVVTASEARAEAPNSDAAEE